MTALALLGLALVVSLTVFGAFAYADAKAEFDHDPDTHTASERIRQWRRKRLWHTALLSSIVGALALIPPVLFLHLVLDLF